MPLYFDVHVLTVCTYDTMLGVTHIQKQIGHEYGATIMSKQKQRDRNFEYPFLLSFFSAHFWRKYWICRHCVDYLGHAQHMHTHIHAVIVFNWTALGQIKLAYCILTSKNRISKNMISSLQDVVGL